MGGWRLPLAFVLALLVAVIMAAPAFAVETRSGDEVIVGKGQTVGDDLYVGADKIVLNGTVDGDLVAFGTTVTVDGTVKGDLIAAGQTVTVNGAVEDDARVAGQALAFGEDARIGDDLISAGASLQTKPGATVGGDLLYGGQQALLAGDVNGNLRAAANALKLAGGVGGNVNAVLGGDAGVAPPFTPASPVAIPDVRPGLTLTDNARIGGNLAYEAPQKAQIASGAKVAGNVNHEKRAPAEAAPTATVLDDLRRLVALLLVGVLLAWAAPRWTGALADEVRERPLRSLGFGALAAVGTAVAALVTLLAMVVLAIVLGLMTLGGLVLPVVSIGTLAVAALIVGFLISVSYLAPIVVGLAVGQLLLGWAAPGRAAGRGLLALAIGVTIYALFRAIPFLGPVVAIAVALLGLGALAAWGWYSLRKPNEPVQEA
jgi:cytoskeletal protein CcmA (bactofilin family)